MKEIENKLNGRNYKEIAAIAKLAGLETRELTSGRNGYPENLRMCVTGFGTYEQAEVFARENGGEAFERG